MDSEITHLQDCAVIASAFEKGAHFSSSEPAIFATLTRGVQATKNAAIVNQRALSSWQRKSAGAGESLEGEGFNGVDGASAPDVFGDTRTEAILKDCLPCLDRIVSNLTWAPEKEFIDLFLFDIRNRLNWLKNIENLLGQQSLQGAYGDLCSLLAFFNSMCIVDLQKILFLLSAMNMDFSINLNGLLPMLRSLIAPLIAPPLASLNNILTQITSLILAPIDCIIQALDLLIRDLDVITATGQVLSERYKNVTNSRARVTAGAAEGRSQADQRSFSDRYTDERRSLEATVNQSSGGDLSARERTVIGGLTTAGAAVGAAGSTAASAVETPIRNVTTGFSAGVNQDPVIADILNKSNQQEERRFALTNGLVETRDQLIKARTKLEAKLFFYRRILAALLGQWKSLDDEYFQLSINKLINIRLISLVAAIIKAKTSGRALCEEDRTPTEEEMNTFIGLFLDANSPIRMVVDEEGNLVITEPGEEEPVIREETELPNQVQVLGLTEDPLVQALSTTTRIKLPCKLKTTVEDVDKINRWMTELTTAS